MATFTITTTTTGTLKADPKGHAEVVYTVTNTSARAVRGLAKAKALDSTKEEWLKLKGEPERDFAPGTTQQFIVSFDGPVISQTTGGEPKPGGTQATPSATGGAPTYSFRLDVAVTTNPDEDFTEGPVVKVEAAVGKAQKKFPYWIIPVAAVVLIGIGVGLYFALRSTDVEVPNVVGMQLADARSEIESKGLKAAEGTPQVTGNIPPGQVIEQSPQAGEKVKKDSEVTLTVEGEEALVEIPDVVKRLVGDATQRLTDAGFTVVTTGTEVIEGLQPNQVVSQKPGGGEKASLGSPVELTVAAERLVDVPDVRFNPIAIARQKLQAAGLKSDEQTPELADASVAPGNVKSQNPAAGAKVPPNSVITLVVAATPTQVPAITGRRVAEAQFLLQQKQLEMVVFGTFNQSNASTVLITGQTPAAGTNVARGSKVTARVPCLRIADCRFVIFDRPLVLDRIDTTTKIQPAETLRIRRAVPVAP